LGEPALFDKIISDPQSLLGDAPLGGIIDCRHPLQTSAEQIGKIDAQLYSAEQDAKIDALLANRRIVFIMDAADSWHLIVGNSGRFIFVVASSGFATLVNISEAITTRIECARDGVVQ
jgi:hypothetical protein